MISQPPPLPIPVTSLADRIKTWPMLAAFRFEHLEAELVALEARLIALEPKTARKSIFAPANPVVKPAPFVPISPPVPIPGQPTPIIEPSTLPTRESDAQTEQFVGKSIFAPATPPRP